MWNRYARSAAGRSVFSLSEQLEARRLFAGDGLKAEYFDNVDFTNSKVTRVDPAVNVDWGYGAPAAGVGADTFSVRWTGQVQPPASGEYTFYTDSDDGVRLWVNNQLVINNWTVHAPTTNTGKVTLQAGQKYDIKMEYFENYNGALAKLSWSGPSTPKQIVPQSALYSNSSPTELPVISLTVIDGKASEQGRDPAVLRFSRTGDTSAATEVRVTTGGTAGGPIDYEAEFLGGYVTIPAGKSYVDLPVTPKDDIESEADETAIVTLQPYPWHTADPVNNTATITISDTIGEKPVLSIVATDPNASEEGSDPGVFTISRTGPTTEPLSIGILTGGTAWRGVDFTLQPDAELGVLIPAGQSSITITLTPIDDGTREVTENFSIEFAPSSDQYDQYTYEPAKAEIAIADNDAGAETPVFGVVAKQPNASESGPTSGTFTFTRTGPTDQAAEIRIGFGSPTTTTGNDYELNDLSDGWIRFEAGQSSVDVDIRPVDDTIVEGDETLTVDLRSYQLPWTEVDPAKASATITIADNDTAATKPVISVVATQPNASEAGPTNGVFTFTRTGPADGELPIRFGVRGTAGSHEDYGSDISDSWITFPAGKSSVDVLVVPVDDNVVEGNETVTVRLDEYQLWYLDIDPEKSVATVTIADNDQPAAGQSVYLGDLNWQSAVSPYSGAKKDRSTSGGTLTINGQTFAKGLGVHSPSTVIYNLGGQYASFQAKVGVDDAVGNAATDGTVVFEVWVDNVLKKSVRRTGADNAEAITVDVTGGQQLKLVTTTGGDSDYKDHADWADAKLTKTGTTQPTLPTLSISSTDTVAIETISAGANFRVTRTGDTSQELRFAMDMTGTATPGEDYIPYPNPHDVVIPAGQSFVDIGLGAQRDVIIEGDEIATFTIRPGAGYVLGTAKSIDITIVDNDFPAGTTYASDLTPTEATSPYYGVKKDTSVLGRPLTIGGQTFAKGLGTHAGSRVTYTFVQPNQYDRFTAMVGIDDAVGNAATDGSAVFEVWTGTTLLYRSPRLTGADGPHKVEVTIPDYAQSVTLVTTTAGDGDYKDHTDWGDAKFETTQPNVWF